MIAFHAVVQLWMSVTDYLILCSCAVVQLLPIQLLHVVRIVLCKMHRCLVLCGEVLPESGTQSAGSGHGTLCNVKEMRNVTQGPHSLLSLATMADLLIMLSPSSLEVASNTVCLASTHCSARQCFQALIQDARCAAKLVKPDTRAYTQLTALSAMF
jgi:hypothetical protein